MENHHPFAGNLTISMVMASIAILTRLEEGRGVPVSDGDGCDGLQKMHGLFRRSDSLGLSIIVKPYNYNTIL